MPFYLSEYIGSGTKQDPFVPVGSDQPGWAGIDLRPDASRQDGGGLNSCLIKVPVAFSDARARFLADDKLQSLTNQQKNFLQNKLNVDLSSPTLLRDIIATIMTQPPANGWKGIRPAGLKWEIWLNELIWEAPYISGGASDDFNRANEVPIASPWFAHKSGSPYDLISNGVVRHTGSSGDAFIYYNGAAVTADQYSAITFGSIAGDADSGPICRLDNTNGNLWAYVASTYRPGEQYAKWVNDAFSAIGSVTVADVVAGDITRLEVQGSSLRWYLNGSQVTGSPTTDTSLTTSGALGVGLFIFDSTQGPIDSWTGGDLGIPGTISRLHGLPRPHYDEAPFLRQPWIRR